MNSPNALAITVGRVRWSVRIFPGILALLSLWPLCAHADAPNWPRLSANSRPSSVCRQALRLARSQFRSDNFDVYSSPPVPHGFPSSLVLHPNEGDISGGNGIWSDSRSFRKVVKRKHVPPYTVYWQKSASLGHRFVALDEPFNWQGDWYTLFSIPANWSLNKFWRERPRSGATRSRSGVLTFLHSSWRPPMVLVDHNNGHLWAVNMGAPYWLLGEWRVYTLGQNNAKPQCTVRFHAGASNPVGLLPKAVRRFARLCNSALGPDQNDGTLHPIETLRLQAQEVMANVAMRPWALIEKPYNTRAEVNADLRTWAKRELQRQRLYAAIQHQYPVAERALGHYYRARFDWSPEKARQVAAHALDIAFRSYFVFSIEQGN